MKQLELDFEKPTLNSDRPCCFNCCRLYLDLDIGTFCNITKRPVKEWDTCSDHDYQRTGGGYFYG